MMRNDKIGKLLGMLGRAAMITSGIAMVSAVHANSSGKVILTPPIALPELARQSGDAMFLHDAKDGRSILYVEQNKGAQLAVFDVTDPSHVKTEGSVPLATPGPFDFVSPLGDQIELVRFRKDRAEAILDFHKASLPSLKQIRGINSQGTIELLGSDAFTASDEAEPTAPFAELRPMRDYQVVDTSNLTGHTPIFEVKQVREAITKRDTGTTFLLAEDGLYVIRRPAIESDKNFRDQQRFFQYNGN